MKTTFLFLIIVINFSYLNGVVEIKQLETIHIKQDKVYLREILKFSVTEDEYFIFPDSRAGDIKIYNNKGNLEKLWGRRGSGPNEFHKPKYCDYKNRYFILMDWGKFKLQLFKREKGLDFKVLSENFIPALGYDIIYIDNENFLISGYKKAADSKEYELYLLNPKKKEEIYLLPAYIKYGCSSEREYENKYLSDIAPVSIHGYCDYINGTIYYSWKGALRILKIDSKTKKINEFGKNTGKFITPTVSGEMRKLYNQRDKGREEFLRKMSFVTGIFADESFVGVLFVNYDPKKEGWQTWVQFYTLDGRFLDEKVLPDAINISTYPEQFFSYVRNKKVLYFLSWIIDPAMEDVYKIIKYQINIRP